MKTAHPSDCTGCRHSMPYATIINGAVHHDGICLRPRARTIWGAGCRHYAQAAPKQKKR